MPDYDNNLFVHGSWCDEVGPARGCARIPAMDSSGNDDHWDTSTTDENYVYGSTATGWSSYHWIYTCAQAARTVNAKTNGVQPIGSAKNRDWCPGRPWLATSHDDSSHAMPTGTTGYNIVG